jgi:glycosyltransferase involved in cell wall biosynthesis
VAFFVREIWPILRTRHPDLEWRLIGRNPHAVARQIEGDARIRATGPVDNGVCELGAVRVAVAPLLAGSGTRFKIIEAWAAGTPVVSTTIGAEGLPTEDLMLADTAQAFADAVSRVITDQSWAATLSARGRATYERQFTWQAAWETLRDL